MTLIVPSRVLTVLLLFCTFVTFALPLESETHYTSLYFLFYTSLPHVYLLRQYKVKSNVRC